MHCASVLRVSSKCRSVSGRSRAGASLLNSEVLHRPPAPGSRLVYRLKGFLSQPTAVCLRPTWDPGPAPPYPSLISQFHTLQPIPRMGLRPGNACAALGQARNRSRRNLHAPKEERSKLPDTKRQPHDYGRRPTNDTGRQKAAPTESSTARSFRSGWTQMKLSAALIVKHWSLWYWSLDTAVCGHCKTGLQYTAPRADLRLAASTTLFILIGLEFLLPAHNALAASSVVSVLCPRYDHTLRSSSID